MAVLSARRATTTWWESSRRSDSPQGLEVRLAVAICVYLYPNFGCSSDSDIFASGHNRANDEKRCGRRSDP
jgi:hypothetical protein